MGLIQNMLANWREKKEERKHMENTSRWEDQIEERKMSPAERDLLNRMEEVRQKKIKVALAKFKQKEMDDVWRGRTNNPVHAKNMFANEKSIFRHKADLLKNDMNLIKPKKLFTK